MHFSIPDTRECTDTGGSTFTVFDLHINGVYHCSLRYRQLHSFHEHLKKEYGSNVLPPFPPKKLLSLNQTQLEERRMWLERYIQMISQNAAISNGETFNTFLLNAQQDSQSEEPEDVTLDVYLMNGHKITVCILSTEQTEEILEAIAQEIDLPDEYVYYFGLYLIRKEEGAENTIVRKLQDFESPYISLRTANDTGMHRIVLRKSFWDPVYDDDLLDNRIAMNLLFVQAENEVDRGWLMATKDQHKQLSALQQKGSKKEYLRLARTLKYYGFLQFKPCIVDYPQPGCRAIVCAGNKELNFRVQVVDQVKEVSFKVTRMRCWRITNGLPDMNDSIEEENNPGNAALELSFEYLVAKDTLKWIVVFSDQAILMSMCLQGMVDELIMKKKGNRIKKPQDRSRKSAPKRPVSSLLKRDFSSNSIKSPSSPIEEASNSLPSNHTAPVSQGSPIGIIENDTFDGIGDDDL